jgi:hypothetical protein
MYDPETKELHVACNRGGTYVYSGVEQEHFDGLKETDSPGSYINDELRGKYGHTRTPG